MTADGAGRRLHTALADARAMDARRLARGAAQRAIVWRDGFESVERQRRLRGVGGRGMGQDHAHIEQQVHHAGRAVALGGGVGQCADIVLATGQLQQPPRHRPRPTQHG